MKYCSTQFVSVYFYVSYVQFTFYGMKLRGILKVPEKKSLSIAYYLLLHCKLKEVTIRGTLFYTFSFLVFSSFHLLLDFIYKEQVYKSSYFLDKLLRKY